MPLVINTFSAQDFIPIKSNFEIMFDNIYLVLICVDIIIYTTVLNLTINQQYIILIILSCKCYEIHKTCKIHS